ncbi:MULTISPECIES: hypothetical protein [unclassified Novosphingobium]|uniref:hypothetical protein n=1 Tax=unclassified Novosphingobium TaxID=2644732 RepID=UPI00135BB712|nr:MULTISPECIES: hypothetical protein [unclassified Novosphingobium]
MRNIAAFSASALIALSLAACSGAEPTGGASATDAARAGSTAPASEASQAEAAPVTNASAKVIGLEGLGDLRIGQPVPKGSTWAERGAQAGDACRTVTSPDYPGVYAIVEQDRVRRITVGKRSDVKLVEGIGVGAAEKDVAKWFAGFREEPHKYEDAPAKYLTAPNAASGDPALRFEIGQDGKVSLIHVGTMPALGYVEGCL